MTETPPLYYKQKANFFNNKELHDIKNTIEKLIKQLPCDNIGNDNDITRKYERLNAWLSAIGLSPEIIVDVKNNFIIKESLNEEIKLIKEKECEIGDDIMDKYQKLTEAKNFIEGFKNDVMEKMHFHGHSALVNIFKSDVEKPEKESIR